MRNCSAEGEVRAVYGTVQARAGVLIGYNAGTAERCFSTGLVSVSGQSSTYAGGLVGRNEGAVRDCYSRASAYAGGVNGGSGGLVGNNSGGTVQRSYSTGHVTGDGAEHTEGGLVGYQSGGSVSDSFYNRETSGKSDASRGTPKTTPEMKQQATFSAWDFTADTGVWRMMETFTDPLLQWQALTADEIIVLDTAALSWDTIRGENDGENNVKTDLSLPASGANGASITWETSPAGYIDGADGRVTRPRDEDRIVTLAARVSRSGGTEQTKVFTLTVKLDPLPPTIDGPTALTLDEGYGAASAGPYTVTGTAPVTVNKTSGDAKITWNDGTKQLDIAPGLTPGSYPVTLEASNGTSPDAALTFTLTVEALVDAQPPVITNDLTDKATTVEIPVTLDAAATAVDGGTISYAWYGNTVRSTAGAAALGVTTASYSPAVSTVGTAYYYCVVTNTNASVNGAKTAVTASAIAQVRVDPEPPAPGVYTVTFHANGGSVSPADMQTGADGKLAFLPTASRSDHRFDGWFTAAGTGSAITADTIFTASTTVYAHWMYTGGLSTAPPLPEIRETPPDQPVTAAVSVTAAAGANGTSGAAVPDKAVTEAIARAEADAKAQGKTENGTAVALNVTMPQGAASLTATLKRSSLDSLVRGGVSQLELNAAPVSLSFDLEALREIQKQSSGDISITIAPAAGLSEEARALLGNRPVYSITVSYVVDGETVHVTGLGGGAATLAIAYTPGENEAVGYLFGVYVDARGNAQRVPGSAYDANSGSLLMSTGHFSVYGVGYTAPSAGFTDIGSHWGRGDVDYVVGRGLFSGTSETTFAPDAAMTRGMLVTALGRLAGVDAGRYTANSFTDVKADSVFQPYIEWAYKNGIVEGIGNGQFAPDRAITREEIAVVFARYAKAAGYKLPVLREAADYADASGIGGDYAEAVTAMQQAGIMTGEDGNRFNPKYGTTRAQASAMLHRPGLGEKRRRPVPVLQGRQAPYRRTDRRRRDVFL